MSPQHVIALATVNARRAAHGEKRVTWEVLERLPLHLEIALNEATFILEALDAADLHVAKVQR